MKARPVLIQTLWRTGGTYLAFRLREANTASLFYEPLHEDFSRHPRGRWDAWASAGMQRELGHPEAAFHYLTDFPTNEAGMVPGHQESFAWQPFALAKGEECPALAGYLEGLAQTAPARAVFKFCRATLRSHWIEDLLGGTTIYVLRDPADMVAAYRARQAGDYFFSQMLRIVLLNADTPVLAPAAALLIARHPDLQALDDDARRAKTLCHVIPMPERIALAAHFWLLSLAAHCRADVLMVDAADFAQASVQQAISEATGLDCELSDARPLDARGGVDVSFADADWREAAIGALACLGNVGPVPPAARRYARLVGGLLT
ncbi:hypothetical protein [Polymorphobacter fuscus]|uniref:Sulfotransferase family protein n=1 Tax=Sandarakinorhabdus fusca TaxID=1439888 RepID=A0A7C9GMF8_9SPHN|nr:hypothetical protein [Polymorphobacter fuscus]KAB7648361.1 hypothetical protein F9290_01165 [Polymorphobacter fuscus]MQT15875.1 hypothetical protein [Polymorphobacter fuscus]NJC07852.1 hypothetical protein [Polymorphobacter fuscus]